MQPFSRRAFLQAVAALSAGAALPALPIDLETAPIPITDALPLATSAGPLRVLDVLKLNVRRDKMEVTSASDSNRVFVLGKPWVEIEMRCPSAQLPRIGERIAMSESMFGHRVETTLLVTGIERRIEQGDAIVCGRSVAPVVATSLARNGKTMHIALPSQASLRT